MADKGVVMPWHLQDPREDFYAQSACGAPLTTGGTTGRDSGIQIECARCQGMTAAAVTNQEGQERG